MALDDRVLDDGALVADRGEAALRGEIVAQLQRLADAGANAVLYRPAGPDIPRELATFLEVAEQFRDTSAIPTSDVSVSSAPEVQHA